MAGEGVCGLGVRRLRAERTSPNCSGFCLYVFWYSLLVPGGSSVPSGTTSGSSAMFPLNSAASQLRLFFSRASFRCARGRYVRGGCIHGPYGSSRPCRVARLDGVKRRACDDCLVHAAVSHEELLLLSPWKHENKLLGSPAVGGIYTGKLDWKRRFAESSNNSVR